MLLPPLGTSRNQQAQNRAVQVIVHRECQGAVKRGICCIFKWDEALFRSQSSERTTRKQRAVRGCMPDYSCILVLRFCVGCLCSSICLYSASCILSVLCRTTKEKAPRFGKHGAEKVEWHSVFLSLDILIFSILLAAAM